MRNSHEQHKGENMALKLEKISLVSSTFEIKPDAENCNYQLSLTSYKSRKAPVPSGFGTDITLGFDLFGKEQKQIKFRCVWVLRYTGSNEDKALLKEHIVVAHAIPYLREYAVNTLMRAGLRQNLLDPTNAFHLWKAYFDAKEASKR